MRPHGSPRFARSPRTADRMQHRWAQLPPALVTIDQVFQKLNKALKDAMAPFQQGPSGNRFVYVAVYPKFKSHEMKIDVTLRDARRLVQSRTGAQRHGCEGPFEEPRSR